MAFLNKLSEGIGAVCRYGAAVCLMIVFVLFLFKIFTHFSFIPWNPTWVDEIVMFFLVWMIFLGATELVRAGGHFMVDILVDKMHGTLAGRICRLLSMVIMLITYAVIFYFGVRLCLKFSAKVTFTLPAVVKMSWFYACIPVTTFFMTVYAVRDVVLAIEDIVTGGKVTEREDAEKAAKLLEDEDAKAVAAAKEALKEHKKEREKK